MVEARADVADALTQWLQSRGVRAEAELTGRATVGLSQETWFVRVRADGAVREAVLRLPTPASGARAIRSQRAALETVAGRIPAPALLWHADDANNPLGRPFIVMERIAGDVPVGWHELSEPARTVLAQQAVDALARLHAIDPREFTSVHGESAQPAQLEWYRRRLDRFAPLPAVLRAAIWWLERHTPPPPSHEVLVHGDYRMGNMVVSGSQLRGVLDWEMAGPGDPMVDLAWCFIPVWEPPGVPESALVRRYGDRVGAAVDEERLYWHRALGYVRLAYYALSGSRAFDQGRSDDFRLAALRLALPVHLDRLAATLAGEPVR